jgi:hypothetical protein
MCPEDLHPYPSITAMTITSRSKILVCLTATSLDMAPIKVRQYCCELLLGVIS